MNKLMGKPSRNIKAKERRQQILESALDVFAGKGYSRTTVKDLANAAGISGGLMYHYFQSKEHLLEEAVQQQSFLPQLRQMLKGTENIPCRQIVKTIGRGFLVLLNQRSSIIDVFLHEGSSNEKVQAIWARLAREGVVILSDYLNARVSSGELRPHTTDVTARSLFSSILVLYFTRDILPSSGMTENEFIDELVDNLLDGIETK